MIMRISGPLFGLQMGGKTAWGVVRHRARLRGAKNGLKSGIGGRNKARRYWPFGQETRGTNTTKGLATAPCGRAVIQEYWPVLSGPRTGRPGQRRS